MLNLCPLVFVINPCNKKLKNKQHRLKKGKAHHAPFRVKKETKAASNEQTCLARAHDSNTAGLHLYYRKITLVSKLVNVEKIKQHKQINYGS